MTIKEAKKLCPEIRDWPDEKINKLINQIDEYCDFAIDVYLKSKKRKKTVSDKLVTGTKPFRNGK